MKRKIILIATCLLLLAQLPVEAQKQTAPQEPKYLQLMENPATANFYTVKAEFDNYFQNRDKGRGTGYKQFMRWMYMAEPRFSPTGEMFNIAARNFQEYQNYVASFDSKSLPASYDPGYWTTMGPSDHVLGSGWNGGIGRVNCIAFHPWTSAIYYVGTPAGGLWKKDGTNPWKPLTDGMPAIGVSGIELHRTNPYNQIYILTGDGDGRHTYSIGVLKTYDGGVTWQPTGLLWDVTDFVRGYKLLMHPTNSNIQYVASSNGIYKTTDGWDTYSLVKAGWFYDIEFKPGDPATMYAADKYDFYKSTNSGDTWSATASGLPASGTYRIAIGVSPDNSSYVYLFYGRSGGIRSPFMGLYRSFDSGNNFGLKSSLLPNIMGYSATGSDSAEQYTWDHVIAVNPADVSEIHIGGINCWKSTDYGANWTITSYWREDNTSYEYTHADIHALEYSPTLANTLYCGSDGGIYKTSNGGANWYDQSAGLVITQFYRINTTPQDNNKVVGGTQDNGCNTLDNNIFTHQRGADGFACLIDYTDLNKIYMSTQAYLYRSTNNGSNFTNITPAAIEKHTWDVPWTMHPSTPTTLYVGQADIYKSTDSGDNWSATGTGNPSDWFLEVTVAPTYSTRVYGVTPNRVYRSDNAGSTWTNITSGLPVSPDYSYIAVDPNYSSYIYVTFSSYTSGTKVYRSTDAGATWSNFTGTSLPNVPVNCVVCDNTSNDGVYIGTDVGVFYRDNTMTDWVPFFNQLPNVIVNEMEINYNSNKLVAGTYGRGIWSTNLYGDCVWSFYLTDANNVSTSSTQYYAASHHITNYRTIYSSYNNTSVTNKAGSYIDLMPDFRALYGSNFEALIGPCTGSTINAADFDIRERVSGHLSGNTQVNLIKN